MEGKKILVVEDDDFLRSLIVNKLQKEGYVVSTEVDGATAIEKIVNNQPDLVILDLMLPAVAGLDILSEIRKNKEWKDIKVVIYSNLRDEQDIRKGLELGVSEYLVKTNFTLEELLRKVKKHLSNL